MRSRLPVLLLLLLGTSASEAREPAVLKPRSDDIAVGRDTRVAAGTWRVPDENGNGVIRITTSGVTLDLAKAALVGAAENAPPDTFAGIGIHVKDATGVTIRGGSIRGFKIAIRAENAPGLVIEGVDASENFRQRLGSTPEREDPTDWLRPHENDEGEWEAKYGAGISLTNCKGARVAHCRVNNGQNGLLLTRCLRCSVLENDFSFNSGWGIALYRSKRCKVAGNFCDWCVRGYSHGVYRRGQDSAGILVFEQCRENVFVGNSATHGGDGFFLYAGNETTEKTGGGGSNDNLVFENDFSHAVANGIEATFSENNTFVRNDCSGSEYGVWAGYSRRSLIGSNKIEGCATGVAIEHGQGNRVVANRITSCRRDGIHLWWDPDPQFVDGVFGKGGDTSSSGNEIAGNDILSCSTSIRLERDTGSKIRWNVIGGGSVILDLGPGTRVDLFAHNLLRGKRRAAKGPAPVAVRNRSGTPFPVPPTNARKGMLQGEGGYDPMTLPTSMGIVRPPSRLPATPEVPGTRKARRGEDMPRGRATIIVGEWGPLDPRLPHVFPPRQAAPGANARLHLTGSGSYEVTQVEGDVEVDAPKGTLPAALSVRALPVPGDARRSALVPFRIVVSTDAGALEARGSLLAAKWRVAWFHWEQDPRRTPLDWTKEPIRQDTLDVLHMPWGDKGPDGLRPDRFATRARCVLRLDAGRYRIRTVSDDGIRVRVGDRLVIDNWTHHAPTEDVCEIDLPAGDHPVTVEHFEIDGWAHLSFRIERVDA